MNHKLIGRTCGCPGAGPHESPCRVGERVEPASAEQVSRYVAALRAGLRMPEGYRQGHRSTRRLGPACGCPPDHHEPECHVGEPVSPVGCRLGDVCKTKGITELVSYGLRFGSCPCTAVAEPEPAAAV